MAKRFTDTEIWDKEWFMSLSLKEKCLVRYLFDKCDSAGVWAPNWRLASAYIGQDVSEKDINSFASKIDFLPDGKIFIVDFIEFQYGTLSENCKPHISIIQKLKKYGLYQRVMKGYTKGIHTLEEKDKVKEMDKDKDKEQEKEGGAGETKFHSGTLVAQMKTVFKKSLPTYPENPTLDSPALFGIAKFFCQTAGIHGPPTAHVENILEAWEPVSDWIAQDGFYSQKSLKTISNHIQEIVQKAVHGDKSKIKPGAKQSANRSDIQAELARRAEKTG